MTIKAMRLELMRRRPSMKRSARSGALYGEDFADEPRLLIISGMRDKSELERINLFHQAIDSSSRQHLGELEAELNWVMAEFLVGDYLIRIGWHALGRGD